jgi:hypothetical protein
VGDAAVRPKIRLDALNPRGGDPKNVADVRNLQLKNARSPNISKLVPRTNAPIMPMHPLNALLPMEVTLSNLGTFAILLQPENALSWMVVTLVGIVRFMIPEQPLKHSSATTVYDGSDGKTSEVNAAHPLNAAFPICSMFNGNRGVTVVGLGFGLGFGVVLRSNASANLEQFKNASLPMRVTWAGMMRPFGIRPEPIDAKYSKLVPLPVLVEIPVIPVQLANALSGMTVKLAFLGNTMVPFNPAHPSNAETPSDVRVGGKYK